MTHKQSLIDYSLSIWDGIKRTFLMLLLLILVTISFDLHSVIGVTTVVPLYAGVVSHLLRKMLFPYIDLKKLISKVSEDNSIASAIIVFGVLLFMMVVIAMIMSSF